MSHLQYGCGIIPCEMQGMTPLVCVKTGTVQALSFEEEECLTAHHMHELTLQVLLQEASEASCCGPCAVELYLSVGDRKKRFHIPCLELRE